MVAGDGNFEELGNRRDSERVDGRGLQNRRIIDYILIINVILI